MTGISRKLPDKERARLKAILKKVTPEDAGVIVRTASEGASEDDLTRDVARLQAQWEAIEAKAQKAGKDAPALLYGEPDLVIRVIRDIFNEDFKELVVQGDSEWDTVEQYVDHLAPELAPRLTHWVKKDDVFSAYRIDEQLAKALDRKVWLPSGGSLVIDRTEAMVVIDVNTGKFTGKGGDLEATVTKNNVEAAEEIVRQLRLRDLGGIIVIDFIDMVLESNRELVLRRLIECLGRDRTKHQVAEVTSLGLVQMTRKRVGQGLLEAFSEPCPECNGRGVKIHLDAGAPAVPARRASGEDGERRRDRKGSRSKANGEASKQAVVAVEAVHRASRRGRRGADEATLADGAGVVGVDADGVDADAPDDADEVALAEAVADAAESAGAVADAAGELSGAAFDVEPAPVSRGRRRGRGAKATTVAAEEAEPTEPAVSEPAAQVTDVPASSTRGRRRRSASRPAGPPVAVSTGK
jgi:ribonuclease E